MKRTFFIFCWILFVNVFVYAKPNYNGGNGTILFSKTKNGLQTTIRKCELEVTYGEYLSEPKGLDVFNDYKSKKKIGTLQPKTKITVLEFCRIDYLREPKPKDEWGHEITGENYLKIKTAALTGWIIAPFYEDIYYNNRYEILETLHINGKKWTIRRLEQSLSNWGLLTIFNKPDTTGQVVAVIDRDEITGLQINFNVIAITEETDTIEGVTEHWLKIKYKNFEGWTFGSHSSAERGGPKYLTPDNILESDFMYNM